MLKLTVSQLRSLILGALMMGGCLLFTLGVRLMSHGESDSFLSGYALGVMVAYMVLIPFVMMLTNGSFGVRLALSMGAVRRDLTGQLAVMNAVFCAMLLAVLAVVEEVLRLWNGGEPIPAVAWAGMLGLGLVCGAVGEAAGVLGLRCPVRVVVLAVLGVCAVGVVLIIYVVAGFILNFGPMALLLRAGTAAVWAAGFALLVVLWGIFTAVVHRLVKMTVVS